MNHLLVVLAHDPDCNAPVAACSCNYSVTIRLGTADDFVRVMNADSAMRAAIVRKLDEKAVRKTLDVRKAKRRARKRGRG